MNVLFAVGVALTTVELRLLAGRSNPYWGGESFVAAQAALATLASAGLGVVFVKRGAAVWSPAGSGPAHSTAAEDHGCQEQEGAARIGELFAVPAAMAVQDAQVLAARHCRRAAPGARPGPMLARC